MIDLVHQHLRDDESAPAREEAYFAGARLDAAAIVEAELERALEDPDPLRGIAQLTGRLGAAFTLASGTHAADALARARRAQPRRVRPPGRARDNARRCWPPCRLEPRRPRPRRTQQRGRVARGAPVPLVQPIIGREGPGLATRP